MEKTDLILLCFLPAIPGIVLWGVALHLIEEDVRMYTNKSRYVAAISLTLTFFVPLILFTQLVL